VANEHAKLPFDATVARQTGPGAPVIETATAWAAVKPVPMAMTGVPTSARVSVRRRLGLTESEAAVDPPAWVAKISRGPPGIAGRENPHRNEPEGPGDVEHRASAATDTATALPGTNPVPVAASGAPTEATEALRRSSGTIR
jgi:hypothetical protein